ncbi:MAG: hypothetical protein ACJ77E_11620 [Gaiellaceae bacterium]
MRLSVPLQAVLLTVVLAGSVATGAGARREPAVSVQELRSLVAHYRTVTWTYQRAAHRRRTPTHYVERRSRDREYLQWSIGTWTRRADRAQRAAVARIERRLPVDLPKPPRLHARLVRRVAYNRRLALSLRRIYPGTVPHSFARAWGRSGRETLRLWQKRSALAAVAVAAHVPDAESVPAWLSDAFQCIHRYEGAWTSNTGNGYYGGLQMDIGFQSRYGGDFLDRWGTADNWPVWAQIQAASAAYRAGRGFAPWPSTARACGLL